MFVIGAPRHPVLCTNVARIRHTGRGARAIIGPHATGTDLPGRDSIEDFCRACKTDRIHTVVAADAEGRPVRVACDWCRSEHNYRGGPRVAASGARQPAAPSPARAVAGAEPFPIVSDRERIAPAMTPQADDLELLLRRIIREEAGITPAVPAAKWRGGTLVLSPGTEGQEKSWPIETFFHKIVMLRNRLRTLEQQVNASDLTRRCEGEAAKLRERLLWVADQLQRAVRRRGRPVQGQRRRGVIEFGEDLIPETIALLDAAGWRCTVPGERTT